MKKLSEQLEVLFKKLCTLANSMNDVIEEAYKIKDCYSAEDEDEDEEPFTHCDNCGAAIWEEGDIVCGDYGHYCCDKCRAEDEDKEDEDEGPTTWCDNCGKLIWSENAFVDGLGGEYCCEECKVQGQRRGWGSRGITIAWVMV